MDSEYSVSVRAVALKRKVEMYQWTEESRTEEHKEPDGTIRTETHYSYSMCRWPVHAYVHVHATIGLLAQLRSGLGT